MHRWILPYSRAAQACGEVVIIHYSTCLSALTFCGDMTFCLFTARRSRKMRPQDSGGVNLRRVSTA